MRTLFLTTAAFAALMIVAPIGAAHAGTGMCYARDVNGQVLGHDCAPDEVGDLCQHDYESGYWHKSKKANIQWQKECGTYNPAQALPRPAFDMKACLRNLNHDY